MAKLHILLCIWLIVISITYLHAQTSTHDNPDPSQQPIQEVEDTSTSITPYTISASPELLSDLKTRLQLGLKRLNSSSLKGVNDWSYGTNPKYLTSLVNHWVHKYDWKKQEKRINTNLQQFTTVIDGYTIHFVHARATSIRSLPVLFVHGWPGSFLECEKIIPIMTTVEAGWAYHLVCPSIPGYAFSQQPDGPGMDARVVSELFVKLMLRLGYNKFLAQGGDWGSIILSQMAYLHPEHVLGLHINFLALPFPWWKGIGAAIKTTAQLIAPSWFFDEREAQMIRDIPMQVVNETAYLILQSTKPQTLGFALNDSPIGLASWLVEKYYGWSDLTEAEGDFNQVWSYDAVLDMVMIYWISGSISSSMRLYYETTHSPHLFTFPSEFYCKVPTGVAQFKDIVNYPREWAEYYYNIIQWRVEPYGGHFAALEEPGAFVRSFASFVDTMWSNVLKKMQEAEKNHKYQPEL